MEMERTNPRNTLNAAALVGTTIVGTVLMAADPLQRGYGYGMGAGIMGGYGMRSAEAYRGAAQPDRHDVGVNRAQRPAIFRRTERLLVSPKKRLRRQGAFRWEHRLFLGKDN